MSPLASAFIALATLTCLHAQPSAPDTASAEAAAPAIEVPAIGESSAPRATGEAGAVVAPANTTRLYFSLASPGRRYSVRVLGTELTCEAPCVLDVPNGSERELVFQMGQQRFRRAISLSGADVQLEFSRPTRPGKLIAGGILLGLGAASLTMSILWAALAATLYNSDGEIFGDGLIPLFARGFVLITSFLAAIASFVIGVATLTPGIILVERGKASLDIKRASPQKAQARPLESLRFAVAPLRDGAIAGAGFRF